MADPHVGHMVYFKLIDASPDARRQMVASCRQYLSDHDGCLYFAAGVLAEDLAREVNDRDFHVALHIVFESRAAHDRYQSHARHAEFIASNKANWSRVRVFDSYLDPGDAA